LGIVIYLCLGAAGAGLAGVSSFFYLRSGAKFLSSIKLSMWTSLLLLLSGVGCLLIDLGRPLTALNILKFSNFGSWATRGFWLLFVSIIVYILLLVVISKTSSGLIGSRWSFYKRIRESLAKVLSLITIGLSFGVAFYTGMLLYECLGIPFWRTPLLPVLFVNGSANIGLCSFLWINTLSYPKQTTQRSRGIPGSTLAVVSLLLLEAVVLFLYLAWANTSNHDAVVQSFNHLVLGELALLFWLGVVLVGYIIPLLAILLSSTKWGMGRARVLITIVMAGFAFGLIALRYGIIFSGTYPELVLAPWHVTGLG